LKFNIMGILFMIVAIWLGSGVGSAVSSWLGMAGGLFGTFIVGLVVYGIFCLISGIRMTFMAGIIFAVMVFIAEFINEWLSSYLGIGGGILSYVTLGVILSLLWGYFGGQSPIQVKGKGKRGKGLKI
jgi:hypothetical protein